MLVLDTAYFLFGGFFFAPVLYLRRNTKWREKFHWPGGYLIAAILLSQMLMPMINASVPWRFIHGRLELAGTLVMIVCYLSGSFRSGTKAKWAICLAVTFMLPALTAVVADFATPLLFPKA